MIAGHAALLAWKSGQPVKIIYDRAEDMVATTKRHPSRTRHRTAVDAETANCSAMDIDFVIDGGAYATLSAVVLSRGTIHAAGPYDCPNVRIRSPRRRDQHSAARRVPRLRRAAEHLRAGAAHGQSRARRGSHAGRIPPPQLPAPGQTTATGQVIKEEVDLDALLDRAFDASGLSRRNANASRAKMPRADDQARHRLCDLHARRRIHRLGRALLWHRSSARSRRRRTRAHPRRPAPRSARAPIPFLSQIAADALGIAYDRSRSRSPTPRSVPNSGPTVASRTCMVVGKLVESAAHRPEADTC